MDGPDTLSKKMDEGICLHPHAMMIHSQAPNDIHYLQVVVDDRKAMQVDHSGGDVGGSLQH